VRVCGLLAGALVLAACSDPPPPPTAPTAPATGDGVHVSVGGRDVIVHCVLACAEMSAELTRLSTDCARTPTSGPHRVAPSGALLTVACCQEAMLSYDRGCGHETLAGCAQHWQASCEGVQPRVPAIDDDSRGVSSQRGVGP
jgi:hypothetical protein